MQGSFHGSCGLISQSWGCHLAAGLRASLGSVALVFGVFNVSGFLRADRFEGFESVLRFPLGFSPDVAIGSNGPLGLISSSFQGVIIGRVLGPVSVVFSGGVAKLFAIGLRSNERSCEAC